MPVDLEEFMTRVSSKESRRRTFVMPLVTQSLGPCFSNSEAKYANQLSRQHDLMEALIQKLPNFDYFSQLFHYTITNWLPFYWHGFQQTTRYTYVIEDLSDLDRVWYETRANIKTDVRKARKQIVVRHDLGIERFLP